MFLLKYNYDFSYWVNSEFLQDKITLALGISFYMSNFYNIYYLSGTSSNPSRINMTLFYLISSIFLLEIR
jgi:hypothetical protein